MEQLLVMILILQMEELFNVNHGVQTGSFSNVGNNILKFFLTQILEVILIIKLMVLLQTTNATTNAMQITEIVYNTPGDDWEWIEIYNPTNNSIDISSYTISDSSNNMELFLLELPLHLIHILLFTVGQGTAQFTPDYDGGNDFQYGILNNGGDSIYFKDSSSNNVDQVIMMTIPRGQHHLMVEHILFTGSLSNNNYFGASWQASIPEYGSPGKKSSEAWDTNLTSSDNLTISSPDNIYYIK